MLVGAGQLTEQRQYFHQRFDAAYCAGQPLHIVGSSPRATGSDRLERAQLTRVERYSNTCRTHVDHDIGSFDDVQRLAEALRAVERACRGLTRSGCRAEVIKDLQR